MAQISKYYGKESAHDKFYKNGKKSSQGLQDKQRGAILHYKYIVAAVLLLLVVSVVGVIGNVSVGASPDTGFFHWLRRDNTGTQMLTSPENLDTNADMKGVHIYKNNEDVPSWAQEWLEIDGEFEMPEGYVWECFEVEEPRNFHKITSYYMNQSIDKEMLLGMVMYRGEISLNTEGLVDYSYEDTYETNQKEMKIYSRVEEKGSKCYIIYFYEGNCQYFMQGHDNLEELKGLMDKYWLYVKNNKKNEIFCNKMLSQAIY